MQYKNPSETNFAIPVQIPANQIVQGNGANRPNFLLNTAPNQPSYQKHTRNLSGDRQKGYQIPQNARPA